MTKRRSRDQLRHERAKREGRGSGHRETYQPYFQVRRGDFASRGRSSVTPSLLFDRPHETLSDLEREALNCLQLLNPHDIREQYPLAQVGVDREFMATAPFARGTVEIAKDLNIAHPMLTSGELIPMTTDFVVTRRTHGIFAVHVKYQRDLDTPRNAELRRIEQAYWNDREVQFCIYTENLLNKRAKNNLTLMQGFRKRPLPILDENILRKIAVMAEYRPMRDAIATVAKKSNRNDIDLVEQVKCAVATGQLLLDLSSKNLSWSDIWPPIKPNFNDEGQRLNDLALPVEIGL